MANKKSRRLKPSEMSTNRLFSWLYRKAQERENAGKVPTLRSNFRRSLSIVRRYWKPLSICTAIYGVLYFLFVRVLTAVNIDELSESVVAAFGDGEESFLTEVITVGSLFGESTNFNSQSGFLFVVVTIVSSLAMIWLLRHIWGEKRVSVRDAFYQGMYPMVPFALVLGFMLIQMLPFSIAAFIFQTAINNSLTVTFVERLFFMSVLATGIVISAYLLVGSIVALYASTVPGTRPSEARRAAKRVLRGRRFLVVKQVLIFMILTGFVATAPMLLVVWQVPQISIVAVAVMIVLGMPWFNLYFYGLYRDLLDE